MPSLSTRRDAIARMKAEAFDVLILGGGINGAGVARDLALRNRHAGGQLNIALIEKAHFGSGTSGRNSQLIHGGLRYLKNLEFRLVREALRERSTLLRIAPHLVEPLPFLIPMYSQRDRLLYSAGLWLYDLLAGRDSIGRHRSIPPSELARIEPGLNQEGLVSAASFFDCRVHSSRLVLENVFEAIENGTAAANYVRAIEARPEGIVAEDMLSGERWTIKARKLVDSTGAWSTHAPLRLVRGSHIVIPRVNQSENAVAYFDPTGRIVFFIPWGARRRLTLIGTTDIDHSAGPDDVRISQQEIDYLSSVAVRLFPASADAPAIAAYSSLRPLIHDGSTSPTRTSREHRIWNSPDGILHIAGGKYTTYRLMSEEAADMITAEIAPELSRIHLTAVTPLPQTPPPESAAIAARREMAQRLRDVMFVSTYWGYDQRWTEEELLAPASEMAIELGWDASHVAVEIEDVLRQSIHVETAV